MLLQVRVDVTMKVTVGSCGCNHPYDRLDLSCDAIGVIRRGRAARTGSRTPMTNMSDDIRDRERQSQSGAKGTGGATTFEQIGENAVQYYNERY